MARGEVLGKKLGDAASMSCQVSQSKRARTRSRMQQDDWNDGAWHGAGQAAAEAHREERRSWARSRAAALVVFAECVGEDDAAPRLTTEVEEAAVGATRYANVQVGNANATRRVASVPMAPAAEGAAGADDGLLSRLVRADAEAERVHRGHTRLDEAIAAIRVMPIDSELETCTSF